MGHSSSLPTYLSYPTISLNWMDRLSSNSYDTMYHSLGWESRCTNRATHPLSPRAWANPQRGWSSRSISSKCVTFNIINIRSTGLNCATNERPFPSNVTSTFGMEYVLYDSWDSGSISLTPSLKFKCTLWM
jgi:hypothetical protein